jgi:hypothetical protein
MSYSISTLLTRNLDDVFGENDPARRRPSTKSTRKIAFHGPGVLSWPRRDRSRRWRNQGNPPRLRYNCRARELGNGGRVRWVWAVLVSAVR